VYSAKVAPAPEESNVLNEEDLDEEDEDDDKDQDDDDYEDEDEDASSSLHENHSDLGNSAGVNSVKPKMGKLINADPFELGGGGYN
jgi:hypothetical protein